MAKKINTRIIHKHDTEANWNLAENFIPKQGELIIYDADEFHPYERFKLGDGKTKVNDLLFRTTAQLIHSGEGRDFPNEYTQDSINYCYDRIIYNSEELENVQNRVGDLQMSVSEIEMYLGYDNADVLGLEVDFVNNKFTRLGAAKHLTPGEDFNKFNMYGKRRRCNVDDQGNIISFYGDEEITPCVIKIFDGDIAFSSSAKTISVYDTNTGTFKSGNYHTQSASTVIAAQAKELELTPGFQSYTRINFYLNIETPIGTFNLPIEDLQPGFPISMTYPDIGEVYLKIGGEVSETPEEAGEPTIYYYTGEFEVGVNTTLYSLGLQSVKIAISTINYSGYNENGSHGQVMVYQPKFYYQVLPYDISSTGVLNKARYYISDLPIPGFKVHPAFIDKNGNEVDYILLSAYEGTRMSFDKGFILDANRATLTQLHSTQYPETMVLCSVAGQQPTSGMHYELTAEMAEHAAQNRGENWHIETIQTISANQLLMIIEYCQFNMQEAIGPGVTSLKGYIYAENSHIMNGSTLTGSTSELGNKTGSASKTVRIIPGTYYGQKKSEMPSEEYAWSGAVAVSYRGMENPWGNIFKFVNGMTTNDYVVYIDDENTELVMMAYLDEWGHKHPFNGFISKFRYSEKYDWLFIPAEGEGNNKLPVGDQAISGALRSDAHYVYGGSHWVDSDYKLGTSGPFNLDAFYSNDGSNEYFHAGDLGTRLIYTPTAEEV